MVIGFTIGSNGQVSSSSVWRNSTGDTGLDSCLANQMRTGRLPELPGGPMQFEMPFSRSLPSDDVSNQSFRHTRAKATSFVVDGAQRLSAPP